LFAVEAIRSGTESTDVAAAVAVVVDREALERGRHELGRAERARPRALEMVGAHVAAREDFQRR
jgi:hypothetical protein